MSSSGVSNPDLFEANLKIRDKYNKVETAALGVTGLSAAASVTLTFWPWVEAQKKSGYVIPPIGTEGTAPFYTTMGVVMLSLLVAGAASILKNRAYNRAMDHQSCRNKLPSAEPFGN